MERELEEPERSEDAIIREDPRRFSLFKRSCAYLEPRL